MKHKINDLVGKRFGKLVVVSLKPIRSKWGKVIWICKCDCGKFKETLVSPLRRGHVKSCGCLQKESARLRATTHGLSKTTEYKRKYNRNSRLKREFNITNIEYEKLLKIQNNKCIICDLPEKDNRHEILYVDHDHKTKKIRGLLCRSCNLGLGFFKDDIKLLQKAKKYLIKHEEK